MVALLAWTNEFKSLEICVVSIISGQPQCDAHETEVYRVTPVLDCGSVATFNKPVSTMCPVSSLAALQD